MAPWEDEESRDQHDETNPKTPARDDAERLAAQNPTRRHK